MALIPKYHTAVAMFPVDPADTAAIHAGTLTNVIKSGMVVGLNTSGYVKKSTIAASTAPPIGLAGDTLHATTGYTAYAASLLVSSGGTKKSSQNRVSDYFDETLCSGLMTVYIVGGEFYTDQISGTVASAGLALYAEPGSTGLVITSSAGSAVQIGRTTTALINYPSGVPGVDVGVSGDYSMPLATQFVGFIMSI
jgi:hypothetical protein